MSGSPIEQLLETMDTLDVDAATAHFATKASFLAINGQIVEGTEAIHQVIAAFVAALRSMSHRVTAQWEVEEDLWVAEGLGTYALRDWMLLKDLPRAFVLRHSPAGIASLHAYGAHEHALDEHERGEAGMWVGGRLIPPL